MGKYFQGIIRASSFFRKEIFEILRQPRLVATLVLGPFLILFIFGIGYHVQVRAVRTLFVVQPNSPISAQDLKKYGSSMSQQLIFVGVTANQSEALQRLKRGEVDLVIVEPDDAISSVKKNQQATFMLFYNEIDPVQQSYDSYLGWVFVRDVNQEVMTSFVEQGQKYATKMHTSLLEAHQNVSEMRQAIQSGNETLATQKQQALAGNVDAVSVAAGASLGLLDSLQQTEGSNGGNADPAMSTLNDLSQNNNSLNNSTQTKDQRLARLDKMDHDITDLDSKLVEFLSISPSIIVSPFLSQTNSVANIWPTTMDFFAPAVLALLLQHLAVTFAALSIVRERNVGTMELFRVSPLSAAEALFGKYISYMLFGGVIAVVLSALLVFALQVPMLGNWWYYALVISAVLFTSLGIGFVISMVSQNDTQAVQFSMIILLASVFFSGFLNSLDNFWPPVRIISWLLPTTYGTFMLRDISLRGIDPNWLLLGGLFAIGLVLMLISWRLMRHLIASTR